MKKIKKPFLLGTLMVIIAAVGFLAYRYDQPIKINPNPDWERTIASLKATREQVFIQSGNVQLEGDLFIPAGGQDRKPAVVFTTGSGSNTYQANAKEFIEAFVLDVFLPGDMVVLLINKRGMGASGGNWKHNDLQGRADDVFAALQYLQTHPAIDPARIGLIGHSQGGWVVALAASQHNEVAFFISLAGPTTSVLEQMEADASNYLRCQGYEGDTLKTKIERDLRMDRIGATIGKVIPIGEIGFMSGIIDSDPREALQMVNVPGLLVYGGLDPQVPPEQNLARLDEIFSGSPPEHLETVVISGAQHLFRIVDSKCEIYEDYLSGSLSEELVAVMQTWLTAQGY